MAYSLKNDIWHFLRYNEEKITVKSDEASEGRQKYTIWSPNNIRHIIILNGVLYVILYCKYDNCGCLIKGSLGITDDVTAKTAHSNNDYILSAILKSGVQSSTAQTNVLSGLESISIIDSRNDFMIAEHNYLISYIANNKDTMRDKYPRLRNIVLAVTHDIDLRSSVENIILGYSSSGSIKTEDICQPIIKLIEANGGRAISNYIAENPDWYKCGVKDSLGRNPKWYVFDEDDGALHKAYTSIYNTLCPNARTDKNKKIDVLKKNNTDSELSSSELEKHNKNIASQNINNLKAFLVKNLPIMQNWATICRNRLIIEQTFASVALLCKDDHKFFNTDVSVFTRYVNSRICDSLFSMDKRHNGVTYLNYIKGIDFAYLKHIVAISSLSDDEKSCMLWLLTAFESACFLNSYSYGLSRKFKLPEFTDDFESYKRSYSDCYTEHLKTVKNSMTSDKKSDEKGKVKRPCILVANFTDGISLKYAERVKFVVANTKFTVKVNDAYLKPIECTVKDSNKNSKSVKSMLDNLDVLIDVIMNTELLCSYMFFVRTMNIWHVNTKVDKRTLKIIQRQYCKQTLTNDGILCPISAVYQNHLESIIASIKKVKNQGKSEFSFLSMYDMAKDIDAISVCPEGSSEVLRENNYSKMRIQLDVLNNFYYYLAQRYLKFILSQKGLTD